MNKFLKIVICIFILIIMSSCAVNMDTEEDSSVIELKLAEMHLRGYPSTDACIQFAELVEKRTEGRVKITVYSNAELGTEDEAIKKVISGDIDIARVNANPLSAYSEKLIPVVLPYVINSQNHMISVMNSEIGDEILDSLGNNMIGLNWYYSGSRCFYSTEPIYSPADIAGKNIRVQNSPVMQDMISCLGGNPIVMDWSEMYDKFEDGSLFAGENDLSSYMNFAHSLIASYYTYDHHVYSPSVVIMSEKSLAKLSEQDQEILRQTARECQNYELEFWNNYESGTRESLKSAGVTFIHLTDEQKQAFRTACQPLYDKYAADCMDIVEEIRKLEK